MKAIPIVMVCVLLLAALAGCKPAEPVHEDVPVPQGDIFSLRISEDPETLDNVRTTSGAAESVMALTFLERLIYIDEQNVIHGWLAKDWKISDDQREVTFNLRDGIKFTDGTDFNAEAVKFHFDRILDKANASPAKAYFGTLQQAVVVDNLTVKLALKPPLRDYGTCLITLTRDLIHPLRSKNGPTNTGATRSAQGRSCLKIGNPDPA